MKKPHGGTWAFANYKEDPMPENQITKLYFIGFLSLKLSKSQISGYIVHFIFYLVLFAHVTVALYRHDNGLNHEITAQDVFCLIVSGSWQTTPYYSTLLPVYFFAISSFVVYLVFLIAYFMPHRYIGYTLCFFTNLVYAYFTIVLTPNINSFVKYYTLIPSRELPAAMYFLVVLHLIIILMVFLASLAISISPVHVVHPLGAKSVGASMIFVTYLFYVLHLNSYITNTSPVVAYISIIVSFAASVYVVIKPIYKTRIQCTVLLTFTIYNTLINIILAIDVNSRVGLYMLIPAVVLSVLIYYVIYPFIVFPRTRENRIEFAYFTNKTKLLNKLLKHADWRHMKTQILFNVSEIALEIKHPCLPDISKEFSRRKLTSKEYKEREWYLIHFAIALDEKVPAYSKSLLDEARKDAESYEKEFWLCAWLSDTDSLPRLAAKIGNAKSTFNSFNDFLHEMMPTIDMKDYPKYKLTKTNLTPDFRFYEAFIVIGSVVFIALHALLLIMMANEFHGSQNLVKVKDFIQAFDQYNVFCNESEFCYLSYKTTAQEKFNALLEIKNQHISIERFLTTPSNTTGQSLEEAVSAFFELVDYNVLLSNTTATTLLDLLNEFPSYTKDEFKDFTNIILTGCLHANIVILIVLVLMIIIQFIVFKRKLLKKFDLFSKIPKDVSIQLGGFEPCFDIKSLIPYSNNFFSSFKFAAAVLFFAVFIICLVLNTLVLQTNLELNKLDLYDHNMSATGICIVERILLYLAQGMSYYYYGLSNQKFSTPFFTADDEICKYSHTDTYSVFISQIPDKFYELFGQEYISPSTPLDVPGFQELSMEIIDNMNSATDELLLWRDFYIMRFIDFLLICIFLQVFLFASLSVMKKFVIFETSEVDLLLNKARSLCDEGLIDKESDRIILEEDFDIKSIDIPLFSLTPEHEILFQSDKCKQILRAETGEKIEDSALNVHVISSLSKAITNFQQHYSNDPVTIPSSDENNLSFILSPHYDFVEKQMELQYVIVVQTTEHSEEMKKITQKLNVLEKAALPPFIKLENLPIDVPAKGRHTIVGLIYMNGFNEWADKTVLKNLVDMRSEMSAIVSENLESCDFLRAREEGNVIVTTVNYKSEVTPWNMHIIGAEIHRKIVEALKSIFAKYNADISPIAFLYKCKATDFVISQTKLGVGSLTSDSEFSAAERLPYCTKAAINYSPEKTETKLQSTTKIRTVMSPRQEKCDIFIIV